MAKVPPPRPDDPAAELAAPFLAQLPITGLAISVFDHTGGPTAIYATDPLASRIEEIQFDLGEGPLFAAYRTGQPVVVADLRVVVRDKWPLFSYSVARVEARAVFDFPLNIGAACVGVVACHSDRAGSLSDKDLETGTLLAGSIARRALAYAVDQARAESPASGDDRAQSRREIYQATGMVLAQFETTATDAFARIQAHAFVTSRTVSDVATDITQRRINLTQLTD